MPRSSRTRAGGSPRQRSICTARSGPCGPRSARSPSAPACAARRSTATSPTRGRSSPPARRTGRRPTRCPIWRNGGRSPTSTSGCAMRCARSTRSSAPTRAWSRTSSATPRSRRSSPRCPGLPRVLRRRPQRAHGRQARPRPCPPRVQAAIGHALAFASWRSLAIEQGLGDDEAAELMCRLVAAAA